MVDSVQQAAGGKTHAICIIINVLSCIIHSSSFLIILLVAKYFNLQVYLLFYFETFCHWAVLNTFSYTAKLYIYTNYERIADKTMQHGDVVPCFDCYPDDDNKYNLLWWLGVVYSHVLSIPLKVQHCSNIVFNYEHQFNNGNESPSLGSLYIRES